MHPIQGYRDKSVYRELHHKTPDCTMSQVDEIL